MSVTTTVAVRAPARDASALVHDDRAAAGPPSAWRPEVIALIVCLGLGAVSALALPSAPRYDGFSWLVWGRELAHQVIGPHQPFAPVGSTSWKPLPVVFTTIFGFFGSAMTLWIAFVRAVGLFGLFAAYRLGDRLGTSRGWRLAGPTAGVFGAAAIVLASGWVQYMLRGTSEPLVVTTALVWIEWHLSGRRIAGFWCGVALCLMRPEASVFLLADALWCLWRRPGAVRGSLLIAGLVVVPLAWVIPPGLATGHFLQASSQARTPFAANAGVDVQLEILKRATSLTVWPVLVAALALTGLAIRGRDRTIVTLAGVSLGYVAVVEAMSLGGFPGAQRFMLPAAAVACVLAAVAVARLAARAGGGMSSLTVVGLVAAIAAPSFVAPLKTAAAQEGINRTVARQYRQLAATVRRSGGAARILPCGRSAVIVDHSFQTALAWLLQTPVTRVYGVGSQDGAALRWPRLAVLSSPGPAHLAPGLHATEIARDGTWRVIRVTRRGGAHADRCVGA